ncbi:MAG TPA: GntR family transcriptional regulator [Dongiaceae bacterium]
MRAEARRLKAKPARKAAGQPIYQRVRDDIAARIDRGQYAANQQLPSERDLSESVAISRMTARQVYVTLQQDGLIYRSNRRGWFVSPPRLNYALTRSVSFLTNVQAEGGTPLVKVLHTETAKPDPWVGDKLGLGRTGRIHAVRRLLSIGEQPAMIDIIYTSAARFPDFFENRMDQSLTRLWQERYGIDITRAEVTIRAAALSAGDAEALQVKPEAAGIQVRQVMVGHDGKPVAVNFQNWRIDVAEFTIEAQFPRPEGQAHG